MLGAVHVTPISLATIRALERALEAEFEACGKTWEGVEVGSSREPRSPGALVTATNLCEFERPESPRYCNEFARV